MYAVVKKDILEDSRYAQMILNKSDTRSPWSRSLSTATMQRRRGGDNINSSSTTSPDEVGGGGAGGNALGMGSFSGSRDGMLELRVMNNNNAAGLAEQGEAGVQVGVVKAPSGIHLGHTRPGVVKRLDLFKSMECL